MKRVWWRVLDLPRCCMAEDRGIILWFSLLVAGAILTWLSIYCLASRIFNDNSSAGITLPIVSSAASVALGMSMVCASVNRNAEDLKLLGGWPNLAGLLFYLLAALVMDVWISQHRTEHGAASGIIDTTRESFRYSTSGAILGAVGHGGLVTHCIHRVYQLQQHPHRPAAARITNLSMSLSAIAVWFGALATLFLVMGGHGNADDVVAPNVRVKVLETIYKHHTLALDPHRIQAPEEGNLVPGARIALTVTGEFFRFHYNSTVSQVVAHNVKSGFIVHVFVLLSRNKVSSWNMGQYDNSAGLSKDGEHKFEDDFRKEVTSAGGEVKLFKLYEQVELGEVEFGKFEQFNRMLKTSEHLLQQFHGVDMVWQHVQAAEIKTLQIYDAVIRQRNDAYWFQPLRLEMFPRHKVSVKGCMSWGGINDKFALVPRPFARAWFEILTDYYLNADVPVYENPEKFLHKMMTNKLVPTWPADAELLACVDWRHYQKGGCFPTMYLGINMTYMNCVPDAFWKFAESKACSRDVLEDPKTATF